ncbi:hypothetical protein UTI89_C0889 [Escherichia coli UTI89]|uniref:Uncharacterized protein n=2 Tax=Escherichia coli TaxID=562 RepID=A0A0H2YXA9_ECOK1|nr:hypothetical protein UTI89_C0889 [Escherichia coli UTI89]ABJ00260.1 conserved hypothetical protein [Escherichia coli APEC O1]
MPVLCGRSGFFLSCLYGSEHAAQYPDRCERFLSCLYGSERFRLNDLHMASFLSCLYGSELKYYTFSPLLIKQNHLNLLLPPFFILTYPQH